MYGRGSASLAEEFHISEAEAKRIIQHFFSKYPRAERWLKEAINSVRRHKQIRNVFGRIRRLPGILSSEYLTKAESERQALNSPIQSAASDMNCNAANRVRMKFKTLDFKGVLCLLVHDSLLYEVPIMEVQESLNIIKIEMERPIEGVTVPMQAEFKVGTRWGLLEEFVPKGDEWYQVKKDPTVGKIKTLVDFNKLEELYAR
jgi:DNA polymerase-1